MRHVWTAAVLSFACATSGLASVTVRPWRVPWHRGAGDYRALLLARDAAGVQVFETEEDFGKEMRRLGAREGFSPRSVRVFEHTVAGRELEEAPAQFEPGEGFHPRRNAVGKLIWVAQPRESAERLFAVYWTAERGMPHAPRWPRAIRCSIMRDSVRVETGRGGVRFQFGLASEGSLPRWTRLAFDTDSDGEFGDEENVLGDTGFAGGGASLTAVRDGVAWYDFGAYQNWPAKAQIVRRGPASLTLRISDLGMYGWGDKVRMKGVAQAKLVGWASWTFTFYRESDFIDQRVAFTLLDTATGWTRDLHVRHGLRRPHNVGTRQATPDGLPGFAWADDFALISLPSPKPPPVVQFHPQAQCLQVTFPGTQRAGFGKHATGSWRLLRARRTAGEYEAIIQGPTVLHVGRPMVRKGLPRAASRHALCR